MSRTPTAPAVGHRLAARQPGGSTTRPRNVAGASPSAGRQPTGVVTMPMPYVLPTGSLTIGRSCGPDHETGLCEEGFRRTVRGLPDRIAQDHGSDGRSGGSDLFPDAGDVTAGEPDRFDEPTGLAARLAGHVPEHGPTA